MTVPALTTYSAGIGAFSSDWGNTVVQGGALLADLRGFQGLSNMTVWMVGTTAQGDGGQGMFVWNGSATTADDGGVTAIAVSGVTTGRWMRQIAISSTVIIGGLAATTRSLQYLTGALTRWNLFTDNSPETGANAGSNLELWRYSDAGAAISQVMWFNRATGAVTVTGSLALGTPLPPASGGTGLTAPGTSGNVLTSNGTVWVSSTPSGGLPVMRALTAGTLYTAPTGLKALRVFVSGATGGQSSGTARGGNGGSGYSEKYYSSPASTYAYAIGAGGSTAGGAGGTSSFDVITVTGSAGVTSSTGGAGGVGSGGDFNATGGTGGNGATYSIYAYAGGGGGAAGSRAGNGFAGAAGVATSASVGTATGGGGGGTGAVGSGVTGGAAKATLSAAAISFFDASAPFTFSAGSDGSIGVFVSGCPTSIPGSGPGGSGANSSEVTGYSYVSSGIGAGGAGGVGNTGSRSGSPGVIVVWEYL